jgi:hypothetical protein
MFRHLEVSTAPTTTIQLNKPTIKLLQPLTEVVVTRSYYATYDRFQTVIYIPYASEKTGNYTLRTEISGDYKQEWFFLYFKSKTCLLLLQHLYDYVRVTY